MIITIDGPTASGKSSVAQALAQRFNLYYINSGLLYRSMAYILHTFYHYSLEELSSPSKELCANILESSEYIYQYENGKLTLLYNTKDITPYLKSAFMDQAASIMSTNPATRDIVTHYQRLLAQKHSIIVDGRDCGTVVFPNADYKFFLTASVEVRAQRWQQMQGQQGKVYSLEESIKSIVERDERDVHRSIAPLKQAPDALFVDNSQWSFEETVNYLENYIKRKEEKK